MKPLLTILCTLFTFTAFSQNAAFVVMDVTGSVSIKSTKKPALVGSKVSDNETIIVGSGGKISLACKNSGYVQYNTPGPYTIKSDQQCKATDDPAIARLCKFAWQQFTTKELPGAWRNRLDDAGIASKGKLCGAKIDRNLHDIIYYRGDFNLKWQPLKPGEKLFIKVYTDPNGDPVAEIPVTKNEYTLAMLKSKLQDGNDYYWNIAPKGSTCKDKYILHLPKRKQYDAMVFNLINSVNACISNKASQQYYLGVLLENKHLLADAFMRYKEAVKIDPGEKRYTRELAAFKKKYGIK